MIQGRQWTATVRDRVGVIFTVRVSIGSRITITAEAAEAEHALWRHSFSARRPPRLRRAFCCIAAAIRRAQPEVYGHITSDVMES